MDKFICAVACSPMRAEPDHKSEMVSQLLFGETVLMADRSKDEWIKVRCEYDGYEGWCQESHCEGLDQKKIDVARKRLNPGWVGEIQGTKFGLKIPFGSQLALEARGQIAWKEEECRFKGDPWNPSKAPRKNAVIRNLAILFLNSPYLWGGKTVYGTDCSGFTQTLFKFFNIPLLRDAWQQAGQGQLISTIEESQCGDLAFFDNEKGSITHVGILMGEGKIIHASGKVRIDEVNDQGIIKRENSKLTHRMRSIKRLL
ncbi:MAG: NlpC/P60 family protein [Chitinophagales bacterium]